MIDILIRDCDILRVENGKAWVDPHQDIAIEGQKILFIRPAGDTLPVEIKEVISASGLLAFPGLMNTHAHISMVLFRGMAEDVSVESWFNDYIWPLESNLSPEDVYWGALLGIAEMIENGVTSVADHYFAMDQVAQAVEQSGIHANLSWTVFGHEGEAKLERTCEFVQSWQGKAQGRITTWVGPHSPYTCDPLFLSLAAKKAKELGVGIHIHVSETQEQVKLSEDRYGKTPIRVLEDAGVLDVPAILAHCRFPTAADLALLARRSTGIAHAPKTYQKLGERAVSLKNIQKAGIPLGLATDGAASSNTLDILEQLRLMILNQKQSSRDPTYMTVAQALEIAFKGSARVLQMPQELGALRAGMLADIALIRQDGLSVFPRFNPAANLVYSSHSRDIDTVICNGRQLMRKRQLLTIDKSEVKRQISERLARLAERVPGKQIAYYPA